MKTYCLNPQVAKALKENKELFLLWAMEQGEYDSDIHPLHNKDYVENESAYEFELLNVLKLKLTCLSSDFNKL